MEDAVARRQVRDPDRGELDQAVTGDDGAAVLRAEGVLAVPSALPGLDALGCARRSRCRRR
ncbi:hypothetical protein Q5762_24735 [Streptomyces sp. P9(2023)]|uniref:hypothetical protein n=1 Tax=Streptomyces sp. P9(2023) TaxID=3064394 RepID=UPI0028F3F820|nr:hypothetical protein [Streptomyces sp. P9(2023)]MDT9691487.1 hypothetical protein [Streptomyces sp. P9(2023)]